MNLPLKNVDNTHLRILRAHDGNLLDPRGKALENPTANGKHMVNNVLLVVIDALRYDRVDPSLTPNIVNLAESGERFDSCYACINATDSSMTTMMTGLYPTHHGLLNHGKNITKQEFRYVSSTGPITRLLDSKYQCIGIDILGRHHKRGFDEYLMERSSNEKWDGEQSIIGQIEENLHLHGKQALLKLPSWARVRIRESYYRIKPQNTEYGYPKGRWMTDELLSRIESNDPWFGLIHYWDTHMPYTSVENLEAVEDRTYEDGGRQLRELVEPIASSEWGKFLLDAMPHEEVTVGDFKRRYDAAVNYVDEQLGRIIDELKKRGEYEDTGIIVTSDHGESLTEYGILFDHHGLYEPTIHVPLVIDAPGFSGREHTFVQHFDIVPTILDMLDVKYLPDAFDGSSLVADGDERNLDRDAVYIEEAHTARQRAVRIRTHKLIEHLGETFECRYCNTQHGDPLELFDFTADGERRNVIGRQPDITGDLKRKLWNWETETGDPREAPRDPTTEQYDEEVLERLESMGYV